MGNYTDNYWKVYVLLLKEVALEKKITQELISDRTGLIQSNVSRIFALKYRPTLDTYLKIADAIGLRIRIEDIDNIINVNDCFYKITNELIEK